MDDKLKLEDIERDYNSCLAAYDDVKFLLENRPVETIFPDEPKEVQIYKQAKINERLVTLGRVGELAYKYLLKLKQLELYSSQNYQEFSKAGSIFTKKGINKLAEDGYITEEDKENLISYNENSKEALHNFNYLELILIALMPDIYHEFLVFIEYKYNSALVDEHIKKQIMELDKGVNYMDEYTGDNYIPFSIFPEYIYESSDELADTVYEEVQEKTREMIDIARENGDIFTRLRYFSNRIGKEESTIYELDVVSEYMANLLDYIKVIHNGKGLKTDVIMEHKKKQAIKYHEILGRSENSISTIFDKYGNNDLFSLETILNSGYTINDRKDDIEELRDLLNEYNILDYEIDLYQIISNNYRPNLLRKCFEHGIFDFNDIRNIVYTMEEGIEVPRTYTEICEILDNYKSKIK